MSLCRSCCKLKESEIEALKEGLPIWKSHNSKTVHFELPDELQDLREGEKLMIQRVNVYVNIHHLYLGQTGHKGHCTAFRQDISRIVNVLPRLPDNIQFIQVIKKTTDAENNICEKKFVIRKHKVLNALQWLKTHNRHYKDVHIDNSRLDWMKSDEESLPSMHNKNKIYSEDSNERCFETNPIVNGHVQIDKGPAPSQIADVKESSGEIDYKFDGVIFDKKSSEPGKILDFLTEKVQDIAQEAKNQCAKVSIPFLTTEQREHAVITQSQEEVSMLKKEKTEK